MYIGFVFTKMEAEHFVLIKTNSINEYQKSHYLMFADKE